MCRRSPSVGLAETKADARSGARVIRTDQVRGRARHAGDGTKRVNGRGRDARDKISRMRGKTNHARGRTSEVSGRERHRRGRSSSGARGLGKAIGAVAQAGGLLMARPKVIGRRRSRVIARSLRSGSLTGSECGASRYWSGLMARCCKTSSSSPGGIFFARIVRR